MKIAFATSEHEKLRGPVLVNGRPCAFTWCWRGVRVDVQYQNRVFGSYANRGTAAKAVKRFIEREA